ncbi:MAG TPA: hypothetical protein VHV83_19355, partial [Armatimonadota bacterium]|nr:hypothetical protein [Armatimonadota bacterium]
MRGRHFAAPRFHLLLFFLISLLVSAVACIALFTANRHEFLRRLTIMHLQSATNSLVQLDDISINPKGHVSLRNLAISDPANPGVTIAAVKTIDIQFSPAQLLAFPTHPIEAIHRVVITRPRMQLSCDRQGRWNFDYIFRGKRTSGNGKFQGEIIVNDGEIIGHDGYGWQTDRVPVDEHFVHLNARLSSAGNRVMPFHITAVSASGHARDLSVNGILRRNNESVECLIRLGSFDLKFAQKFLGKRLPFEMLSGRADARWQLVVARNNRNNGTSVKMTLITDVHQVTGRLHTGSRVYQCFISQGQVRYAPSVVEFVGIDGRVNDIPITLNGTISNFGDIIFALHGHVNQADGNRLSELIPGLKRPGYHWSGAVTGTTQITGHLRDIQVTGHFQGLSLSTAINGAPLAVTNINSDVQYCGDTVRLTNVSATAFGGMIHGSAWLNASNNPKSSKALLLLQCTTAGLNAKSVAAFTAWSNAKLANQLGTNIDGSLSGPVSLSLTKDNTFTLISSVQGIMSYGSYGTAYANTGIEITAGANQSLQTSINHAELMTPYGYFRIQGSLNTATLDLSLQGNEVRLAAIGKLLQRKDVDGKGFVSGKISGSFDNPVFTGNIRAQNGKFANRNFAELSSEVSCSLGTSPLISLKNIRLLSGGHQLELSAAEITTTPSGKQWSDGQWHVQQIALSRSRLSSLAALIGLNLQVDGFAEGTVEYADFPKGVKGKGTIALNRPSVQLDGARIAFDRMTIDFSLRDEHTIDISDAKLTYEGQPGKTSTITITGSLSTAPNIPPN